METGYVHHLFDLLVFSPQRHPNSLRLHGARQAPLSVGFPGRKYWSGQPVPPPGDLPHPGGEARSPALQVESSPSQPPGKPCV